MEPQPPITAETVRKVCRDGPLSDTVVEAVAEATGVDALDLTPLYRAVDPDALDAMGRSQGRLSSALELRFRWQGCHVLVQADGEVLVRPTADVGDSSAERFDADR